MNIGRLNRLINLQQPQLAPADSFGGSGQQVLYADVAEVWAAQKPGAGSEVVQANQLTAVQTSIWEVRYRPDVQPTWQFVCEGAVYAIVGVQELGRRQGLSLTTLWRGIVTPTPPVQSMGFPLSFPIHLASWPTS